MGHVLVLLSKEMLHLGQDHPRAILGEEYQCSVLIMVVGCSKMMKKQNDDSTIDDKKDRMGDDLNAYRPAP